MMNYPLTVSAMLRRAETLFGEKQIVSRRPDRSLQRISYRDLIVQVKQLSLALGELGVRPGDRVATLAWNHAQHLETYFAVPTMGAILHTLNPRLHPDDLDYIMQDAGDSVLLVDQSLLPLVKQIPSASGLRHIVVMQRTDDLPHDVLDYDELIAAGDVARYEYYESSEDDACSMCYTSGTTGRPKGVVYSHRAVTLHSMASAMATDWRSPRRTAFCRWSRCSTSTPGDCHSPPRSSVRIRCSQGLTWIPPAFSSCVSPNASPSPPASQPSC